MKFNINTVRYGIIKNVECSEVTDLDLSFKPRSICNISINKFDVVCEYEISRLEYLRVQKLMMEDCEL